MSNPRKSNTKKRGEAAKKALAGFESLHAHLESRSQSGFPLLKTQPGQKPGQIKTAGMVPYKLAQVYNGEKDWFVHYSYWSLSAKQYVRQKVRLNQRGLDKETRQAQLEDLCTDINAELKQRNRRKEYERETSSKAKKMAKLTLVECLRVMAAQDGTAESRVATYLGLASKLEEFGLTHPSYVGTTPQDVDEGLIEHYRDYLKAEKYASKTVNKHLWGIQAICEDLGLKISTEEFRVKQIKNETGKYPPLTDEEKERAFAYFKEKIPGYQLMLLCQYYTCIRPAELQRLQAKNFDFKANTIYVPWYDSKNGLSGYVQMFAPLKKALLAAGVHNLPGNWYPFGYKCVPSAEEYEGDWPSATWTGHRDRMGMPKEKQSYGLKHTFNRDYVEHNKLNGIDWEFLRRHNRHTTVQQTQDYISDLTAYYLNERKATIIDYSGNTKHRVKAGLKQKKRD